MMACRERPEGFLLQLVHPTKSGKVTVWVHKGDIAKRTLNPGTLVGRTKINLKLFIIQLQQRMEKIKVELVIEKGGERLWGSVKHNDNLIADYGDNLTELERKFKILLQEFEGIKPEQIVFEHRYDVLALFNEFDFLNISKVAKHAEINAGLLKQYASGVKHPSLTQAKKIEETLHRLATKLQKASVYTA